MVQAEGAARSATLFRVVLAFAAVYLIWGSTYLVIAIGIETIPPFVLAGSRFLIAGTVLYAHARLRGAPRPSLLHWRNASIIGGLLLLGGNGGVVWAETRVPSGIAALLVAVMPLWMTLCDWLRPGGQRPAARAWIGLAIGFAGVALIVAQRPADPQARVDLLGASVLVCASMSWSIGSIFARHAAVPKSPLLLTAMEMLAGGALLTVAAAVSGQLGSADPRLMSARSLGALAYLIMLGSIVAFSAYVYLLGVTTPSRVSTYAYVNPVVAVILGWLILNEPLTIWTMAGAAIIVTGVVLITRQRATPRT